ncbi:unnamed protein product [Nezara viridula]|uniref:Uncharacterized protein n=1 Tax=Nezara viridula TaxID=85310 RepID=A0A9P0MVF8_NEZVI|nr:unnamed protein product [Nezara viridula]
MDRRRNSRRMPKALEEAAIHENKQSDKKKRANRVQYSATDRGTMPSHCAVCGHPWGGLTIIDSCLEISADSRGPPRSRYSETRPPLFPSASSALLIEKRTLEELVIIREL